MKLSTILNEARKGEPILMLKLNKANDAFANSSGSLTVATTIFRQKYVPQREGDEIVESYRKEQNITSFKQQLEEFEGCKVTVRVGKVYHNGIIDMKN